MSSQYSQGADNLGDYQSTTFTYKLAQLQTSVECSIKLYPLVCAVVFEQHVPLLSGTSSGDDNAIITGFPTFQIDDVTHTAPAGYAHWVSWYYGGNKTTPQPPINPSLISSSSASSSSSSSSNLHVDLPAPGFETPLHGRWNSTLQLPGGLSGTGVTCVFSSDGATTAVLSALQPALAISSASPIPGSLQYGVMGGVTSLPAGARYRTLMMVFGRRGITAGVRAWGTLLRAAVGGGKGDASVARARDVTLQYLGYTTDNGMYGFIIPIIFVVIFICVFG